MNTTICSDCEAEPSTQTTQREDNYPSRTGNKTRLLPRQDPVVYTSNPIDHAQAQEYKNQGFLILHDVFSKSEVKTLEQELGRLRRNEAIRASDELISEPGSGDVRSVFRIHQLSTVFNLMTKDQRLAGLAQNLLDDQVYVHQSRANYKAGFRGKEFYWHSDFETWHVEDGMPRMRALSMSVTLTENHDFNGPLMLIPGSHKTFVSCEGTTPDSHFKSSLQQQEYGVPDDASLDQLVKQGGIVNATGKPGSVIVFDCNLMHGSNGNITPFPRSNAFIVYNAMSNRVGMPFCQQRPRPEYLCSRRDIEPIVPIQSE